MIVDIPFAYKANVIMPRCRKESAVAVRSSIPIKIEEVADAPVAAVWTSEDGRETIAYRVHKDALACPLKVKRYLDVSFTRKPEARGLTLAEFNDLVDRRWSPFIAWPVSDGTPISAVMREDRGAVREWISDTRDVQVQAIQKLFRGATLIDGTIHTPSLGPVWQVAATPSGGHLLARAAISGNANEIAVSFRADRRADALDFVTGKLDAMARRDDWARVPPVRESGGVIDVLRPEAFAAIDDDWLAMQGSAKAVITECGPLIQGWRRDAAIAYLDLRDALVTWPVKPDAAALRLAKDFVAVCPVNLAAKDSSAYSVQALRDSLGRMAPRELAFEAAPAQENTRGFSR